MNETFDVRSNRILFEQICENAFTVMEQEYLDLLEESAFVDDDEC